MRMHRELEQAAFAYAPSNSRLKISNTSAGGVYGRSPAKRFMLKYTASSRIHSTGSSTTPVLAPSSSSS
jgi:hypothetical protein